MQPTRRDVLWAAAAAGPLLHAAAQGRLLAQVYVFTQEANRRKARASDEADRVLGTVRAAGFHGAELMSDYFDPKTRPATLAAMKKNGVAVPVVYMGANFHDAEAVAESSERALVLAAMSEAGWININPAPKPKRERKTDAELATQARALNRLGIDLRQRGHRLMVHHHDPEMAEDAREWRHMLGNTDPWNVSLCLDTHWMWRGGQDPVKLIAEAGKRTAAVHLRNSRDKVWTEAFGPGDLDYNAIARALRAAGADPYLTVELAYEKGTPGNWEIGPALRTSREYAERVFGLSPRK